MVDQLVDHRHDHDPPRWISASLDAVARVSDSTKGITRAGTSLWLQI